MSADPIDIVVGRRVRARRNMLGMTQETLAEGLGLTFQQIQKYEAAKNRISCSRIVQIASLLQTPLSYFFDNLEGDVDVSAAHVDSSPDALHLGEMFDKIQSKETRNAILRIVLAAGGELGA